MAPNSNPAYSGPARPARRQSSPEGAPMPVGDPTFETHYRIADLARLWGLGRETVRKLVKDDPGVIRIHMGHKKVHTFYSVPESAARRIHTRLLAGL